MTMRNFDFAPLYRSTVGFDHLRPLLNAVTRSESNAPSYPPYNIELIDKDQYRISMAVAGFTEEELDINVEKQFLTVKSKKPDEESNRNYLHQGIAARNFERRFQLAEHVEVSRAQLASGLLHIELSREVPEAMKPKSIPITRGDGNLIGVNQKDAA
jgi:molecular chaperone IbpA